MHVDPRRALVPLAALVLMLPGCTDDDPDPAARSSTSAPPVTAGASIDDIRLSNSNGVALAATDDTVVLVDGLALDGDQLVTRIWIALRSSPRDLRETTLNELGPLASVELVAWGDELLLAGVECPDALAWQGGEDPTTLERCGSTSWVLHLLDPATGHLEQLASGAASIDIEATTADGALVTIGGEPRIVEHDGGSRRVQKLPGSGNTILCGIDGAFVAVAERDIDALGGMAVREVGVYFDVHRLEGGTWVAVDASSTSAYKGERAFVVGCAANGFIGQTIDRDPRNPGSTVTTPIELSPRGDGDLAWSPIPVSKLPNPSGSTRRVQVMGGDLVVGMRTTDPGAAHVESVLFRWGDDGWTEVSDALGELGYGANPRPEAVLVADDTQVLATRVGGWEAPLSHSGRVVLR